MQALGYLSIILHAHLPFVHHPEEDYFLEENWLYEAITETYMPLLDVFERCVYDEVPFAVTMSLTPPLINMLNNQLLQKRYLRHLDQLIALSKKEMSRTQHEPHYRCLAQMYHDKFVAFQEKYNNVYHRDLVAAFKKYQELGCLEIIASAATHGFLPILSINKKAAEAQIRIGIDHYRKTFQCQPQGFWLPECAFSEGVDQFLKDEGIRYFLMDTHGILHADPAPVYNVFAPVYCPSGVAAFARDTESSKQVWSAEEGYPGDVDYREYYRDIGHECEFDYIRPHIHPQGIRINTGIKYWRITGKTEYKEVYRPDWAREKAATHAGNFMFNRQRQMEYLASQMDRVPLVISPYDAELFGHWWFEGPQFLEFLFRKIAFDQTTIELITPSRYLSGFPCNQMVTPSASSWGYKGYSEFWLNDGNDWIYRHLNIAALRLEELARQFEHTLQSRSKKTIVYRALNQAARELLLAQASDWPFIMKTGTMVEYAQRRVKDHLARFTRLYNDLQANTMDRAWLKEIERRDCIFSNMDCISYYQELKKDKKRLTKKRFKKEDTLCQKS